MIPLGVLGAAAARAAGAWSPADLSPLEWFDYSDAATVTLVGGSIESITSKGSGGRVATAPSSSARPAFSGAIQNGRDAALFNGSTHHMALSSAVPTTTPMWVAQVFGRASTGIKSMPLGGGNSGVPPYATQWWTDNVRYSALWGTSSGFATHGTASTETGVFQHVIEKGASTTQLYQDGSTIGSPQPTLAGSANLTQIGRRAGDYHNGMLCEVIIGTAALDQTSREKLEGYLAHKWGLAGSLPLSHPYRGAPP